MSDAPMHTQLQADSYGASTALPQPETGASLVSQTHRSIRPLGEQIIIRVLPPKSVGSIIIPDSAKGSTHQGEDGSLVHFVEADVIAVGPGKRGKRETLLPSLIHLLNDIAAYLDGFAAGIGTQDSQRSDSLYWSDISRRWATRASEDTLIPLQVKAGNRILYHPAVQSFDRKINPELIGLKPEEGDCYIIGEHSVLAILDMEK